MNKSIFLFIAVFISMMNYSSAQSIENLKYIVKKSTELNQRFNDFHERFEELNSKDYVLVERDITYLNEKTMERHRFENAVFAYLEDLQYTTKKKPKKRKVITKHKLKDTMAYLTVSLVMFDHFLSSQLRILGLKKIRRFLNTEDKAIGKKKNLFKKSIKRFTSYKFRRHMKRAIKAYELHYLHKKKSHEDDFEMQVMHEIIQSSYTYEKLAHQKFWASTKDYINILYRKVKIDLLHNADFFNKVGKKSLYLLSKGFGNVVGLVQFRNGYLYNDADFLNQVTSYARPLDIILEKTPFRLTDKFIPGFWGHAAIYVGNEIQLREIGIWDHPVVQKYHEMIKVGKTTIEALRSGVELNSLKHFSNIDDFALIRSKTEWEKQNAGEHIIRAFRQIGKTYDFAFDVETPTSIVCSELHYTVFRDLTFQTTNILNRNTINVDQVSLQGYSGNQFEPHILYLNGQEITENIQKEYDNIVHKEQANPNKTLDAEKVEDEWIITKKAVAPVM